MIKRIRLSSQQLLDPNFDEPKALVSWLGAMQAQEYNMAKWAIGLRLKSGSLKAVDEALERGDILRTHIMRPTWHFVAAEDIRWLRKLTAKRIIAANSSFGKERVAEAEYRSCNNLFEKMLEGGKSLTKQELEVELDRAGVKTDHFRLTRFLTRAEVDGVVCSGVDQAGKPTYALLEERVAPVKELHHEEALARLATQYFRSHSPATLADFVWWSGLTITEARRAVNLIADELENKETIIHKSCNFTEKHDDVVHLLPSYDEYLISYKDRSAVLADEYKHNAFNNWGIFYPVIAYNGTVVGNWNKSVKRGQLTVETSFFHDIKIDPKRIKEAEERYRSFFL